MGKVSVVIASVSLQSHGHCEAANSSRGNLAFLFLIILLTLLIFTASINNSSSNYLFAKEAIKGNCPHKESCLACHKKETPGVVKEWKQSKHGMKGIACTSCHGANRVTDPDSCKKCHKEITEKFKYGKHGFTMLAAKSIFKKTPSKEEMEGNCGTCHRLYAQGKCKSCHNEHKFEIPDTKDEESCKRCHKEAIEFEYNHK